MKKYQGYLIDLDGTMYRGKEKIEEASHFVKALFDKKIPYLFVTNNSSRTPQQVAQKLRDFGIPTLDEQVFTTSNATANYIYEYKPEAKIYVIGEEGIRTALMEKGFEMVEDGADVVVSGIDRSISYEKLALGAINIRNGARFISTNGDIAIPTERGLLPGNGSLTSVLTVSTETQPTFIGKPEKVIMEQAMKVLGVPRSDVLMVGDNYHTDIKAGMNAGMDTLLVHTGVTTKAHLETYEEQPTYTAQSLAEWIEKI